MSDQSSVTSQRDFSAGEVDDTVKRDDTNPLMKAGARQMSNWRILNSKSATNRPGRRALFEANGRVDKVLMSPGNIFHICFGAGTLKVRDNTGAQVFTQGSFAWSASTAKDVVWALYGMSIWITFPGQIPKILTWDGTVGSGWSVADFAVRTIGNQKRTLFYRIAAKSITLTPAAATGNGVGITFSANVLVAGMVGTYIRYQGRQLLIATVTNGTTGTADIKEPLQGGQRITFAAHTFVVGDVVYGQISGATGAVTAINTAGVNIDVTLSSALNFTVGDRVTNGVSTVISTAVAALAPPASVVWDQEVMNTYQGWPQSVFIDQNRLGFCNFVNVPAGIAWSAEGDFTDFYPDAFAVDGLATDAIFELAPNKVQVLYVIPGMEASEFIFCDSQLFYIPINATNPLRPGSVEFKFISQDGCYAVQPKTVDESIVFIAAGGISLKAIITIGAYNRPYETGDLSILHTHLFNAPVALAIPTADGTFPERYAYVVNADGTVAIGRYNIEQGKVKDAPGWLPWSSSVGLVKWMGALGADVVFVTAYTPNGIGVESLCEILDDTRYLDASQLYTTQPAGLPIPGGKGPLWYLAGGTVDLMDGVDGTRMMGTYVIDANGFLVPQGNAGEDFTSAYLVAGQAWTATLEPFIAAAQPGQDLGQRMWKRRLKRFQVYVTQSSGFVLARLWGGDVGPLLPAPGTIMKQRRISTWNQDEDPTQQPRLREGSYLDRPIGRAFDPREAIIKDTPGPLIIQEVSCEVTI